jgi:CxC1 like cysteine cluster associated with KDZ transposases
MSFCRPKARYKRHLPTSPAPSAIVSSPGTPDSSSVPPQLPSLIPLTHAPRTKRPRHSVELFLPGPEALLALPGRRTFTQPTDHSTESGSSNRPATPPHGDSYNTLQSDDVGYCSSVDLSPAEQEHDLAQRESQRRKGKRQYARWTSLITLLVPFHLRLMRETHCLRARPQNNPPTCTCGSNVRTLAVVCVYFHGKFPLRFMFSSLIFHLGQECIKIDVCLCAPAAQQLLSRGLFPCAPLAPSLAVDITLLTFARELFVRIPPNMSAFSESLESFLHHRGHQLHGQVMFYAF